MMKRIFCVLTLVLLLVACKDDESFSTDSSLRLTFGTDTLQLDTVFSRTPSSTYGFWVYNRNDDGIRLRQVRLRRGNQSGFRVNVDGVYLDNANGSQVSDLEVRRGDSILVFVELTPPASAQTDPQPVEDDLLFYLESGAEQKVCLRAWAWDAQKVYDLEVTGDSLIESTTPMIIYGTLQVKAGATLTIRNTTLYFHDQAGIDVYGTLKTDHCVMRGDRLDRMFSYLPYDRISGQWKGVRFYETSIDNELMDTEIRNAVDGMVCDSARLDSLRPRLSMTRCIVHNSGGHGVKATHTYLRLQDCQLTNAQGDCLAIDGGIADVNYCTLGQFYPFSADCGAALRFSDGSAPIRLACDGSILTGYNDDVLMGQLTSSADYAFSNSLLRTPRVETADSVHYHVVRWESPSDSIEGRKHFRAVDFDHFYFDFHLDSLSTAAGLGCYR